MRVPLSWLRDFAAFDLDPVTLGEVFDDLGMVVESLTRVGEGLGDVIVARVLSIEPISGADKIRKVVVDAGGPDPLQIVCGAWNFTVGDLVPLARVGAVLPGGFEIGRRKMKGIVSEGMLCSAPELALGDDAAGLLVLGPDSATPGTHIAEALGIEADVVYDLAIEANRPDANCIAGVARDAAARLRLPFAIPEPAALATAGVPSAGVETAGVSPVGVEVTAPELCDRFTATAFAGITIAPSLARVARRLTLAGMRPISNVVDASNYVMLELGQPTHAYDLERLAGPAFVVRAARPGERLVTLDGVERVLGQGTHADCVICDGHGVAIGIAGIMGGASSEVHAGTTTVALEAAHFVPMAIARTSKRIGLRSEASARFERGVDFEGIDRSVARFAEVLAATSPGLAAVGPTVDWRAPGAGLPSPIRVRTVRVNAVLGTELDAVEITRLLEPIGFAVSPPDADGALAVTPPSFRPDAVEEIDVVEEVARHHGYERIARRTVRPAQVGGLTPYQRTRRFAREVLAGAGLCESAGSPLLGPGDHAKAGLEESTIAASDPLAREESVLRTSLRPGLLKAVAYNQARRLPDLGLFEIGHVWSGEPLPDGEVVSGPDLAPGHGLPDERELLVAVLAGHGPGEQGADAPAAVRLLDRLKTAMHIDDVSLVAARARGLHPTRTAEVLVRDRGVGWVGEIDPAVTGPWGIEGRVGYLELDLPAFAAGRRAAEQARPVSRFPSSDLDLAFIVDEGEPAGAVRATLARAGGGLLEWVTLFDVYRGPGVPAGARNLAFRLRFVAHDRTLTETELGVLRDECIRAVESAHPATLRA